MVQTCGPSARLGGSECRKRRALTRRLQLKDPLRSGEGERFVGTDLIFRSFKMYRKQDSFVRSAGIQYSRLFP